MYELYKGCFSRWNIFSLNTLGISHPTSVVTTDVSCQCSCHSLYTMWIFCLWLFKRLSVGFDVLHQIYSWTFVCVYPAQCLFIFLSLRNPCFSSSLENSQPFSLPIVSASSGILIKKMLSVLHSVISKPFVAPGVVSPHLCSRSLVLLPMFLLLLAGLCLHCRVQAFCRGDERALL